MWRILNLRLNLGLHNLIQNLSSMKNNFLILAILFSTYLNAQNISMDWGEPFKDKTDYEDIIGFQNETLYVESDMKVNIGIQIVRKPCITAISVESKKPIYSEVIKLPKTDGVKVVLFDMVLLKNGPVALGYSLKKNRAKVYAFTISSLGKIEGEPILLFEQDDVNKVINPNIFVEFSKDKSKFMLIYARLDKQMAMYKSDLLVFDNGLSKVSERRMNREFNLQRKNKDLFNLSVYLNNDGSYLSCVEETKFLDEKIPEYSFTVTSVNVDGEETGNKTVGFEERGIYKPYLFFSDDKATFQVVGFYSDLNDVKIKFGGYTGVYTATLSTANLEVLDKTMKPFSKELLAKIHSEKEVVKSMKKGKGLPIDVGYEVNGVYSTSDGGYIVHAEFYNMVETSERQTHYFGNVIVIKIDEFGNVVWENVLYKGQVAVYSYPQVTKTTVEEKRFATSTHPGAENYTYTYTYKTERSRSPHTGLIDLFMEVDKEPKMYDFWSYVPFHVEDEFIIMFNDTKAHPENDKNHKVAFSMKKYQTYKVSFDIITGDMTKENVSYEIIPEDEIIEAGGSLKISESEAVLVSYKKGFNRLGIIKF